MLIPKLRLQRGWSQEQLAELRGLSVRTIQRTVRVWPGRPGTWPRPGTRHSVGFSEKMPL